MKIINIFCDKLKDTFEIGTKRRRNPKYHSLSNSMKDLEDDVRAYVYNMATLRQT